MSRPYPDLNSQPEIIYQPPTSSQFIDSRPYPSMPYPGFNQSLYANNHVNASTDSIAQRVQKRQVNTGIQEQTNSRPPLNTYQSQESFPNPHYDKLAKVRGVESIKSGQYSVYSNDSETALDNNNNIVNELGGKLQSMNIQQPEQVPENVARFNAAKKAAIDDYSKNQFNGDVQLNWVKVLFDTTTDSDFISNYNINGEKLPRTLSDAEVKKNEHIFIKQAIKILKKICTDIYDHPEALFILGSLYSNSDPQIKVPRLSVLNKNYEKSFKYYERASRTNHVVSTYRLAVCYEFGIGTNKNFNSSFTLFEKAAELGSVPSMFKLGLIYGKGLLSIPRDAIKSHQWFLKASQFADLENPHALFELAKYYEFDLSNETEQDLQFQKQLSSVIQPDINQAFAYYKQAAKLNYHPAQFKLGWCYEYGKLNCIIDARKSIGWYSRSAKQGNYQAEMALSGWYLTGAKGVLEPNDQEAFLWANKSAESGFVKAEYALGYFYEVGLGCEKNLELSKKFYLKAATNGHEKAIAKLRSWKN
ncbi:hypothetical protein WICPIJ_009160 [Wickerhamomyces pijperi]|uniref:Activator of C kinase protein 1 n=1 Tax=Wickerhamomyces pijperi TaxID=599730 RepID=A0A9P8PRE9_WICPI|nr:hypothetical protein WICPIJ_009160 [Wickerhamomyces pijperi]